MIKTEYVLHPWGRRIMFGLLFAVFVAVFATVNYWIFPINSILGLFTTFRVGTGFFVRGAGGLFFSIAFIAILLEFVFDKISWYRLEFDGDKLLTLRYRGSLIESYKEITFSLRYTKVQYIDNLMWLVSSNEDRPISILLYPPDEIEEVPFYDYFDEEVDENYYKVKKILEQKTLEDIERHYLFRNGKIYKFDTRDFSLVTGIDEFYPKAHTAVKEDSEDDDDDVSYIAESQVDYHEFQQIMEDAEEISVIK